MSIVTRAQWGARYPDGGGSAPLPASEVWLHHSVTIAPDLLPPFTDDDAAVRTLELIGQQRFGQGISYTFAVTPVGRVHHGHSPNRLGAHTGGRNSIARAICWIGNYDITRPTPQMIEATAQLLVEGRRRGWWRSARLNGGHRQAPGASTTCPGRYGMEAIPAINARAAAIEGGAPTLEDDMDITELYGWRDNGGRNLVDFQNYATDVMGQLARAVADVRAEVAELRKTAGVSTGAPSVGGGLTAEQIADAAADEADRRARDGDPATGPVS